MIAAIDGACKFGKGLAKPIYSREVLSPWAQGVSTMNINLMPVLVLAASAATWLAPIVGQVGRVP